MEKSRWNSEDEERRFFFNARKIEIHDTIWSRYLYKIFDLNSISFDVNRKKIGKEGNKIAGAYNDYKFLLQARPYSRTVLRGSFKAV